MAQKLECDRCGGQVPGSILYPDGAGTPRPSASHWDFVRAPWHKGKSTSPPNKLLCPDCIGGLHAFLAPLPGALPPKTA
jgi:hypothetical protein